MLELEFQTLTQTIELHSQFIDTCLIQSETFIQEKGNLKRLLHAYKWSPVCYGEEYDSIMDMLLCNLFPLYKRACRRFYQGRGKSLKESYSRFQIFAIDLELRDKLRKMIGRS